METAGYANQAALGQLKRNKTWDEQDATERVQALRAECRELRLMVVRLQAQMRSLRSHAHMDGAIVIPLHDRDASLSGYRDESLSGYRYDPLA